MDKLLFYRRLQFHNRKFLLIINFIAQLLTINITAQISILKIPVLIPITLFKICLTKIIKEILL